MQGLHGKVLFLPRGAQLPSAQLPESGFSTERAQAIYGKDAVLITKGKSAEGVEGDRAS